MKFSVLASALVLLFLLGCSTPRVSRPEPENVLNQLLEKIEKAGNPDQRGKEIKTMRVYATSGIEGQDIRIKSIGTYRFPDCSRTVTLVPGQPENISIFDGKEGWDIVQGVGENKLKAKELKFRKFELMINSPVLSLKQIFPKLSLDSQLVTVNGRSCYRLVGEPDPALELDPVELFFDAETYLPARQRLAAPTPLGEIYVTIDCFDYKNFDGLNLASRSVSNFLVFKMTTIIDKIEFNLPVADAEFELPSGDDDE